MFNSSSAAAGKRKMKEVDAAEQFHHFASSPPPRRHSSQVQQILNTAAPAFKPPFSFTSLLTTTDDDEEDIDRRSLVTQIKSQTQQIDQILLLHTDILRQAVGGMLERQHKTLHRAAEETAAKKLKQKEMELQMKSAQNAELERKAEHYKKEAERLSTRVVYLERATMSLKSCLEEATATRRYAETTSAVQEEAESSSFEDPDRVGPVRLPCKVCYGQLATVMMWPCRHVGVCTRCDVVTKVCPVCRVMKTTSVELYLSLD